MEMVAAVLFLIVSLNLSRISSGDTGSDVTTVVVTTKYGRVRGRRLSGDIGLPSGK